MDVGVVAHATGSAYVEFNHTKVRPRHHAGFERVAEAVNRTDSLSYAHSFRYAPC